MTPIKTALAGLAATGLLLAQPAAAASQRTSSPAGHSEQLAGGWPAAATPALIAILAVAIVSVIAAASDNDHNDRFPVSP